MVFRLAERRDLESIVAMLSDDPLGAQREQYELPLPRVYEDAFTAISEDENQELTIVEVDGEIIGTFHLTFVQYLTYRGGLRAQIEAVRVKSDKRGTGIGKEMFQYAIDRARQRGAHVLQLTTDKKRPEALKFYEALGFKASHEGMKLHFK